MTQTPWQAQMAYYRSRAGLGEIVERQLRGGTALSP